MKIRALTYILLVGALFGSAGCSELAGSGELVSIPQVSFTCSAGNCTGGGTQNLFRVTYSSFGCDNAGTGSFNAKRTKTGFLSCNGASCSGSTSGEWVDESGIADTTLIPADNYTVCIVVFRDSDFNSGATADDAYAEQNVAVSSSSPPFNITSFSNGVP